MATVATAFRDSALVRRLGAPTKLLPFSRGELAIWIVEARGLVATVANGHATLDASETFLRILEGAVARGAREVWDDWAKLVSYDSECRLRVTAWTRDRPELAKNIHVLVGSKLMAMGMAVANLALGQTVDVTSDRTRFERELLARL